ncbi:pyridoxamine 5'-phosphate oxidase family protein [bacterium]|nr:pyridoxamine 5'-phosphate oxidase family protein [bacterium]
MAKQFKGFDDDHQAFIAAQAVYFVATSAPGARINLSPKGMDSLRVLGPKRLIWLNVTGSGNETAAHLPLDARMTVMWCSFDLRPLILRAYGTARCLHRSDADWAGLAELLPALPGARQIYDMTVDLVQTSCGYAVPRMEAAAERPTLRTWAEDKGEAGIAAYWDTRNRQSIDGLPTGIEANL